MYYKNIFTFTKKLKNLKIIVYSKTHFDLLNNLKNKDNIKIILKKNFIDFVF